MGHRRTSPSRPSTLVRPLLNDCSDYSDIDVISSYLPSDGPCNTDYLQTNEQTNLQILIMTNSDQFQLSFMEDDVTEPTECNCCFDFANTSTCPDCNCSNFLIDDNCIDFDRKKYVNHVEQQKKSVTSNNTFNPQDEVRSFTGNADLESYSNRQDPQCEVRCFTGNSDSGSH